MDLGVCAKIKDAAFIKNKGFDYIEMPCNWFTLLKPDDFDNVRKHLVNIGIACKACNFFFPNDLKITGPDLDISAIEQYCIKAVSRIKKLGVETVTVGSGPSRYCPKGFPKEQAIEQFKEWLIFISDLLWNTNIMVCIEPIRKQSTNILNTLIECISLANKIDRSNIRVMTDFQQMRSQGDLVNSIVTAGSMVKHVHISNSNNLRCPQNEEEDTYRPFFSCLKEISYDGRISIETTFYDSTLNRCFIDSLLKEFNF